jgi:S-disulfanyl-L-cysteine oxidoreductase SoxD
MCCSRSLVVVAALAAISAVAARAQTPSYPGIGRAPSPDEIRKWDIAIGPSGTELPPGRGTVPQGEILYVTKHCVVCHGPRFEGTVYGPRLIGGAGTLTSPQPVRTVGSYWPFATTLWDYINRAMPRSPYQEGSLTPDEVYSLTALLLYQSEIISATDTLDAKSLPKIRMPNRDGFFPARPDWKWYQQYCRLGRCGS